MSGTEVKIKKEYAEIKKNIDENYLELKAVCKKINSDGSTDLTKLDLYNADISKADKLIGKLEIETLPSSPLVGKEPDYKSMLEDVRQKKERLENRRNNLIEFLTTNKREK